jgi:hypothetical protein
MRKGSTRLAWVLAWTLGGTGCASILGIEEQTVEETDAPDEAGQADGASGPESGTDSGGSDRALLDALHSEDSNGETEVDSTTSDVGSDSRGDVTSDSAQDSKRDDVTVDAPADSTVPPTDGPNDASLGDADATIPHDAGDSAADSGAEGDAAGDVREAAVDGGCSQTPEDCTNGIDDNCDGKIDCADPECVAAGYECATTYGGWSGPIILYDGDGGSSAPSPASCPTANPDYGTDVFDGHRTPNALAAVCTCGCGTPADAGCPGASIELFSDPDCGTSMGPPSIIVGCTQPLNYANADSVLITAPSAQSAPCDASAAKSVPSWNWMDTQRACKPTRILHQGISGGCASGQYCVDPPPTSVFTGGLCIYQTGNQSCSTTPRYPYKHVSYDGGADTRDCDGSACACQPGSVSCTVDGASLDPSADDCSSGYSVPTDQCIVGGVRYVSAIVTASPPTSCAAVDEDAATPVGQVTPTGEVTFCCTQ